MQVSTKSWILHALVEDARGSKAQALLELSNNSRIVNQMHEGHTLLLVGARTMPRDDDRRALGTWPSAGAMRSAEPWLRQQEEGGAAEARSVLLWGEAEAECKLFNISATPGVLNSPSLSDRVSIRSFIGAHARGRLTDAGSSTSRPEQQQQLNALHSSCVVDVVDVNVQTHRIHRSVTGVHEAPCMRRASMSLPSV